MLDRDELREIDSLGEEELPEEESEELWTEPPGKPGWGGAPLLQAVLCALLIGALVFFKFFDGEKYREIARWYGEEMAQEIELPRLEKSKSPSPTPDPTPEPSPPAAGTQAENGPLQLL